MHMEQERAAEVPKTSGRLATPTFLSEGFEVHAATGVALSGLHASAAPPEEVPCSSCAPPVQHRMGDLQSHAGVYSNGTASPSSLSRTISTSSVLASKYCEAHAFTGVAQNRLPAAATPPEVVPCPIRATPAQHCQGKLQRYPVIYSSGTAPTLSLSRTALASDIVISEGNSEDFEAHASTGVAPSRLPAADAPTEVVPCSLCASPVHISSGELLKQEIVQNKGTAPPSLLPRAVAAGVSSDAVLTEFISLSSEANSCTDDLSHMPNEPNTSEVRNITDKMTCSVDTNKTPPKLNVSDAMVSPHFDRRTSKRIATLKKTEDSSSMLETKKKSNFPKEVVRRNKT
jgi:hypothetical protein